MYVHNFLYKMVVRVKMLLFLELLMVLLCIFIVKKDILVIRKDPTQELNETTITAKAKYPISVSY